MKVWELFDHNLTFSYVNTRILMSVLLFFSLVYCGPLNRHLVLIFLTDMRVLYTYFHPLNAAIKFLCTTVIVLTFCILGIL
jgi:hypothetical protein